MSKSVELEQSDFLRLFVLVLDDRDEYSFEGGAFDSVRRNHIVPYILRDLDRVFGIAEKGLRSSIE
jgi:hypothetical protein